MGISTVENIENKEFSPKEIREMFGIDNSQIQELCKKADIKLKRNDRGLTYFTKDDAQTIQRMKQSTAVTVPSKGTVIKGTNSISNASIVQLVDTLKNIESSRTSKLTSILD